jgi:gamma-glutamyltranspeptidase
MEKNGVMTLEDLKKVTKQNEKNQLHYYKRFKITHGTAYSGICLNQIMKMIEPHSPKQMGQQSKKRFNYYRSRAKKCCRR